MLRNTRQSYGLISQGLHWVIALAVLALFTLGLYMHGLPAGTGDEATFKSWFYSLHKTLGVLVFGLAILRIIWSATQPRPVPLHPDRPFETLAAQTAHWTLYAGIILMPLTGWLHHSALEGFAPIWLPLPQDLPFIPKSASLANVFAWAHYFTGMVLALTIFAHVGGALKHMVVDRDKTLSRMIPGTRVGDLGVSVDNSNPYLPPALAGLALLVVIGATAVATTLPQFTATPASDNRTDASASGWQIDHAKSALEIEVLQSGNAVLGNFSRWNAVINFNPEDLTNSNVEVTVETASLSLGGVTQQATSPDFLNASAFPTARFVGDQFVHSGGDAYEVAGQLTLLAHTQPLVLPFTLRIEGKRAHMNGLASVKRLDFGVGAKGFPTGGMVGLDVTIRVTIEAVRGSAALDN